MKKDTGIKLGPGFFVNGDKKMMVMTRAADAFDFGIDGVIKDIDAFGSSNSVDFLRLYNNTLNAVLAEVLLYFHNRISQTIGKDIGTVTSVPAGQSFLQKKLGLEIKHLIGDKGYKELKKLDENRGKKQHKNDRYFGDFKVNKVDLNSPRLLKEYVKKIQSIVHGLDERLDTTHKTHEVVESRSGNTVSIEMKAITHSFDLTKGVMNKKDENV